MGYLVCEKCGGYYQLQEEESPNDFNACECGGNLKFVEQLSDYYYVPDLIPEKPTTKSRLSFLRLFKLKAIFLGVVTWIILDALLYGVPYYDLSVYYLGNIAIFPLIASQLVSSVITGYLSGKKFKTGILNGIILGILFTIALYFLKTNTEMISLIVLAILTVLGSIGGVIGVLFKRGISGLGSRIKKTGDRSEYEIPDKDLTTRRKNWPKDLAGWLFGLGILLVFFSYTIFGALLLFIALLVYVSGSFTAIYACMGGFLSYSLIQMMIAIYNLINGNLSIYEREDLQVLVALTVFNIAFSVYVIIKTRRINKSHYLN